MPGPPPINRSSSRKSKRHSLSDGAREKLIDLLGLDPSVNTDEQVKATRAIKQVEEILGLYEQHLEDFEILASTKARGRPRKEVFQKVVGELRRTFRQECSKVENTREIRGAISSLSPAENDEQEFIRLALIEARIAHPKKIRRTYNKQGTPLAERNKVIKNIEAEANRRAKNSPSSEDAPEK
jgi:hypothetical protein